MDFLEVKQISNAHKIAILLSTYNGELYVSSLIDSILNQTYQDFTLYIRDDGSKDETVSILEKYNSKSEHIVLLNTDGQNMGSKYSFLYMLKIIESDYYMFCDQDDIWLPNKIEDTFVCLQQNERLYGTNTSITVHTDLCVVDQNLNILYPSYWEQCKISDRMPHTLKYLAHYNDITGCTQMFNKAAVLNSKYLFGLKLPKNVYHDWLLAVNVAHAKGKIIALNKRTILFRRHQTNETIAVKPHLSFMSRLLSTRKTIKRLKERYKFAQPFGFNSFLEYFLYKLLTYLHRVWIQKRV